MAKAIVYDLELWTALVPSFTTVASIDNIAERALRCVTVGHRNWLFAVIGRRMLPLFGVMGVRN